MILLTLGILREQLLPPRDRLDRIDHVLLWTIKLGLLVLFLTLPPVVMSDEEPADSEFFSACSGGKFDVVKSFLKDHPSWVDARTDNGEACLHLAGIYGHADVTEHLLVSGANPNIRSTFEQGLRMHPLSWNVYGGHVANVDLLIRHGANVNLDFDGMGPSKRKVTALDVVNQLIENEDGDRRFVQLEELLKSNGAKTMKELAGGPKSEEL